jgi:hypothetical protein
MENHFLGTDIFNGPRLLELILRLGIDFGLMLILVLQVYRKKVEDSQGYVFTFFVFNLVLFFICYLLSALELSIGFGFGLFALFSILRYRTVTLNIREMSFLFVVISLAIINSLPYSKLSWVELFFIDASLVGGVILLNHLVFKNVMDTMLIKYERIELIQPEHKQELLADLRTRTGLEISHFRIESVNFMSDSADIRVYVKRMPTPSYNTEP